MKSDLIVVGAGPSGLMAAYSAASRAIEAGIQMQVTVLEKMPRPARKLMITGKGRCNFTNLKDWNSFSAHVRSKASLLKPSFYNMTPEAVIDFFEGLGTPTVVERGDRAFPASHRASDIVDALVLACNGAGVKIVCESPVSDIDVLEGGGFSLTVEDGTKWLCRGLVIATGGLSYPSTGSTGDGYRWAEKTGHIVTPLFPSLTALVPAGYKETDLKGHIDRETPLSRMGEVLCGVKLKNVGLELQIDGSTVDSEFGDVDFTDGGLEGPLGFQLSRKAVKSLLNGSRVSVLMDLKPGVPREEVLARVKALWDEVGRDPRSTRLKDKEKCRILLGKLMPWELIPAFFQAHPQIVQLQRRGRTDTFVFVDLSAIATALKCWRFDIVGYVGYERAVVTAGGVSADSVVPKTLESRSVPGLYFCGEVLDVDADTGGYNLQAAFSTGALCGRSAAGIFIE